MPTEHDRRRLGPDDPCISTWLEAGVASFSAAMTNAPARADKPTDRTGSRTVREGADMDGWSRFNPAPATPVHGKLKFKADVVEHVVVRKTRSDGAAASRRVVECEHSSTIERS
jgi:hypothetical protein